MTEEESDEESRIVYASFADPYLLLVKDDQTVTILNADESGDLDEVQQGVKLAKAAWTSGSLYEDSDDVLRLEFHDDEEEVSNVLLFLLGTNGGLHVCTSPVL